MSAYRFIHNFDLIIVTEARAFKLNPNDLKIKKKKYRCGKSRGIRFQNYATIKFDIFVIHTQKYQQYIWI